LQQVENRSAESGIDGGASTMDTELVFEVTEETDGGYSAECLTEDIFTQGDTWQELRANVKDVVNAYFFDGPKPQWIRLRMVRNEILSMK
jgi:predicted RNase H-like HicB family nuclease